MTAAGPVTAATASTRKERTAPVPPVELYSTLSPESVSRVGIEMPLWPENEDSGEHPDRTALYAEGCVEVDAVSLLESWTRHTLVWINRWTDDGPRPLHAEWRGLAQGIGEEAEFAGKSGTFLGVDERFGMLLRDQQGTHLIPLSEILENA